MKWANFLHFYQPVGQQKDILEAVVNQCYRPVFKGLREALTARLTINVSGGLLEALDANGFSDVINDLKSLYETGRVEFTSTACYHAFLPLLPENEIRRQIQVNNSVLKKYLGDIKFRGFFPPEMAYAPKLLKVLEEEGFEYILLDEIALGGAESVDTDKIFHIEGSKIKVFFRQRNPSNVIMSGIERDSKNMEKLVSGYSSGQYLITAMDGETFGHHRPGLEKQFLEVFEDREMNFCKVSDLLDVGLQENSVSLVSSTWASSAEDLSKGVPFISWKDPENIIHTWQWELVDILLKQQGSEEFLILRDRALASDQFFWASAKPWWSLEMIESGAHACVEAIYKADPVSQDACQGAQQLYRQIISKAFEWQRTGAIRRMNRDRGQYQRIPFKTRTMEGGGVEPAIYEAFIDMMRDQEKQAAARGEYEKAILWRDSVYKIENKSDIYDAINAIDLLRIDISNEKVEHILDEYTARYKKIRGGQPEQRSN